MSKYKQTFTIDRSKWRHSHNPLTWNNKWCSTATYLYTENDSKQEAMCCLGFVCNQLGIPKDDLYQNTDPMDLAYDWNIPYLLKGFGNSKLTSKAININDSTEYPPKEKERLLKKLFNEHGLGIRFIGEYPEGTEDLDLKS